MLDFTLSSTQSNSIFLDNELEYITQQIDLLFDTDINEVLGDTEFGSNYDKYLYTLNLSNAGLEQKIKDDLLTLVDLCGRRVSVSVHLVEGTIRDIAYIDIFIEGNNNDQIVKSYVIN